MTRPRLLDLFCGAGGAAAGYMAAGFDVTGVDITDQPRYPFTFHRADAMTFPLDGFDAVHASPPCHDHSTLAHFTGPDGTADLLRATMDRLAGLDVPWVVENVAGADMPGSLVLCGTEFGLCTPFRGRVYWLRRHRRFASNVWLYGAGGCNCAGRLIGGVYGNGGAGKFGRGFKLDRAASGAALGIDWMNRREISQAIPPAYTEFIGEQLLTALRSGEVAA